MDGETREERLHPTSLLFRVLAHARGFLIPALAVVFFARGDRWEAWFALVFVVYVGVDVVQYLTFTLRYAPDELVVSRGWLVRSVRHVPYARIHNLDVRQNVLHRALRVAEVRIETAGGTEPEAVLRVISMAQCEALRARVFATPRGVERPQTEREVLVRLGLRDVALLALDPGRGLALLAIGWGLAWEYDLLERFQIEERIGRFAESGVEIPAAASAALFALTGLVLLYALSFAGAALAYYGFTLELDGDQFRVRRGILTREQSSLPRRRIQLVSVREPLLLRLLGLARVSVATAGGGRPGEEAAAGAGTQIAPLFPRARLPELLERLRPGLALEDAPWRGLDARAPRRFAARALLRGLPIFALLAVWLAWWGAGIAAVLALVSVFVARAAAKRAAWARADFGLAWRQGLLGRETSVTFPDKLQSVLLVETPFDRRHGHATLRVDTAGALLRRVQALRIPCLAKRDAQRLREDLLAAAGATTFRW